MSFVLFPTPSLGVSLSSSFGTGFELCSPMPGWSSSLCARLDVTFPQQFCSPSSSSFGSPSSPPGPSLSTAALSLPTCWVVGYSPLDLGLVYSCSFLLLHVLLWEQLRQQLCMTLTLRLMLPIRIAVLPLLIVSSDAPNEDISFKSSPKASNSMN